MFAALCCNAESLGIQLQLISQKSRTPKVTDHQHSIPGAIPFTICTTLSSKKRQISSSTPRLRLEQTNINRCAPFVLASPTTFVTLTSLPKLPSIRSDQPCHYQAPRECQPIKPNVSAMRSPGLISALNVPSKQISDELCLMSIGIPPTRKGVNLHLIHES